MIYVGEKPYLLLQVEPYIHEVLVESDVVNINHKKHKLYPVVVLVKDGFEIEAEVNYLDEDNLQIRTNAPIIFKVIVY